MMPVMVAMFDNEPDLLACLARIERRRDLGEPADPGEH
jgi:hypothetical protein